MDALLDVVEACARVLAPHGSLVFELGDTYSGSGGAGGDYGEGGRRAEQPKFSGSNVRRGRVVDHDSGRRTPAAGWPLAKSLCGIPTLFAWSLAYGRNLLRPERTTDPWRIRNVVAWCRPNPPVGFLADKFRGATSYLTVATKATDRYFDLESVRRAPSPNSHPRTAKGVASRANTGKAADDERRGGNFSTLAILHESGGSPPLDYWELPTQPYKGSHYAAWPPELLVTPVKAMCPERVCRVCGRPSTRVVESEPLGTRLHARPNGRDDRRDWGVSRPVGGTRSQVGWTDCGHDAWRRGVVLDPFAGSGTTLAVATGHGRDALGIDLDERNAVLARERVGMFLEVERVTAGWAGRAL